MRVDYRLSQPTALVTRSRVAPIAVRTYREPSGLLAVNQEDAAALVELLRKMTAEVYSAETMPGVEEVLVTFVGLPGAEHLTPSASWYDAAITLGWAVLVEPAAVGEQQMHFYSTNDPGFIASNAGPDGEFAILGVGPTNTSVAEARALLAEQAAAAPTPLVELRPDLKQLITARPTPPAEAAVQVPAWLKYGAWALAGVTAAYAFYVLYYTEHVKPWWR